LPCGDAPLGDIIMVNWWLHSGKWLYWLWMVMRSLRDCIMNGYIRPDNPIIIQYHSYRTMNGKLMGQGPENRCSSAMATENWEIPLGRCLIPIVLHGLYNCKHVSQGET
jgi:hypothetical protein